MSDERRPWSALARQGVAALPWLAGLVALWTLARGASAPMPYGQSQWLLDYRFGFARRALAGTLVEPLLRYKSAEEVELILVLLAFTVLLGLLLALGLTARAVLRPARGDPWGAVVLWSAVFVLASSPWLVSLGNTVGFQDHLVGLVTLAGVWAAYRGRWLVLAVLVPAGIAFHELFLLAGLPVVLFAALLAGVRYVEGGGSRKRALLWGGGLALWAAALGSLMLSSATDMEPSVQRALKEHVVSYGVFTAPEITTMISHVPGESPGTWMVQVREFLLYRLLRPDIALAVYPPALALVALAGWLLSRSGRRWLLLPLAGVALAPLGLHAVAWDATRFASMTLLHGWMALVAVLLILRPALAPGRRLAVAVAVVAAGVCLNSALRPIELLGRQHDGDGMLTVRWSPTPVSMRHCRPVLSPGYVTREWTASGAPFLTAPFSSPRGAARGQPVKARALPEGWETAGRQLSREFVLDGDVIVFTLEGRRKPEEAHVALLVDGVERLRATLPRWLGPSGYAWEVERWYGRTAQVEIVDERAALEDHLEVRGLCWFDPTLDRTGEPTED